MYNIRYIRRLVSNIFDIAIFCALIALPAAAQQSTAPDYNARNITLQLSNAPQPVPNCVAQSLNGLAGNQTYYYWIVAHYTVGDSAVFGPCSGQTTGFSNPGGGTSFARVYWTAAPGALNYNVLRTTTPVPPTGVCGCSVNLLLNSNQVQTDAVADGALNPYTVNTFDPNTTAVTLSNQATAPGLSHVTLSSPSGAALIDYAMSFGPINIPLTNAKFPSAYAISSASGNVDLYTVPAGRNALVLETMFTNPIGNAGAVTTLAEFKDTAGTYHTFDFIANNVAAGAASHANSMAPFLLHAGEKFAVNNSASGMSVWAYVVEFDATVPIFDARLLSLSSGANTLFTVPAGKTVSLIGFPAALNLVEAPTIWYWNNSGGARTITVNIVPNAGSPANANAIFNAGSILNQQMSQVEFMATLNPGDFININTDAATATQTAWVIYTQKP